jgi:hypothetical protein
MTKNSIFISLLKQHTNIDVGIPLNSELVFENMSTIDIELMKTLKEYL